MTRTRNRIPTSLQSSIKCCHAVTAWRAEQGSCEPVSELRARSREREIGSQSFCSQLETREDCKREIGSQSFCSQLEVRKKYKKEIGSQSFCSQLKARKKYKREIGSQSFCSQLEAREECKREIGSQHIATPHPKGPYW